MGPRKARHTPEPASSLSDIRVTQAGPEERFSAWSMGSASPGDLGSVSGTDTPPPPTRTKPQESCLLSLHSPTLRTAPMRSLPGGHTPESLSAREGPLLRLSALPLFRYSCYKSLLQKVLFVVVFVFCLGDTQWFSGLTKALSAGDYTGLGGQIWVSRSRGQQPALCIVSLALHRAYAHLRRSFASQFPGGCIPVIQDETVPPSPTLRQQSQLNCSDYLHTPPHRVADAR